MSGGTKAYAQIKRLIEKKGNASGSSLMISPVARTDTATAISAVRIERRCARSTACSSLMCGTKLQSHSLYYSFLSCATVLSERLRKTKARAIVPPMTAYNIICALIA